MHWISSNKVTISSQVSADKNYLSSIAYYFFGFVIFILFFAIGCTKTGEPQVHPDGWSDTTSVNSHSYKISNSGIETCKSCHGEDFSGGIDSPSCFTCHSGSEGIGSCTTCHGDSEARHSYPPRDLQNRSDSTLITVGAHKAHMESDIAIVSCDQCHIMPISFLDEDHLGLDNVAEITFGNIATDNGKIEPKWNPTDKTCSQTYCHGNFTFGSILGNDSTATWTNPGSVVCGFCHNLPPEGHFGNYTKEQCYWCHSSVNSSGDIKDKSKHINGSKD